MTMTTVGGIIDVGVSNYDISNYIVEMDLWREAMNGIGRWEVIINNPADVWGATFTSNMEVQLLINTVTMMRGYVDDVVPFLDRKGQYTNMMKISGRDYGMPLAHLFFNGLYLNTNSNTIIIAALAGSGITLPVAADPNITYEWDRTFLSTGIRDIAKEVGYDFYVDDTAGAPILHYFTLGAVAEHNAVNLISDVGGVNNNILHLEEGEQIGGNIRNHIEVHAGHIDDHWTDGNAAAPTLHWAPGASCSVSNEATIFLVGKSGIRVDKDVTDANYLYMTLTFPRYSYDGTWGRLDLTDEGVISYYFYLNRAVAGPVLNYFTIELTDNGGNVIHWYKSPLVGPSRNNKNYVNFIPNNLYYTVQVPVGRDVDILPIGPGAVTDFWWFRVGAAPFNWADIRAISFTSQSPAGGGAIAPNQGAFAVVDVLSIPNVEARSINVDLVSQGTYGVRMKEEYMPRIKSQIELDAYGVSQLAKYKDPLETLHIVASGETGTHYAAQSLDVRAPSHGIPALIPYRIMKLHHSVKLSPERNEYPGYDFITEYDLLRDVAHQPIDPIRFTSGVHPLFSKVETLNDDGVWRVPRYRRNSYWA